MPPNIAAILCVIFIFVVITADSIQNPDTPITLWIPLIWFMIIASRPVVQWFEPGNIDHSIDQYFTGSPIDRNIFTALMIISLFILSNRIQRCTEIIKKNKWIIIFFLYCCLSIAWSDYPATSFKRYIRGIGTALVVLVVLTENEPIEALKTILKRSAYILLPTSILFIKYFRHIGVFYGPWGGETLYTGVATHKNTLGQLCLITGFYFYYQIAQAWCDKNLTHKKIELFFHILFLFMALWLLVKSNSATSLGCFIISIIIFHSLGLSFFKNNVRHIGIIIIFLLSIFIVIITTTNLAEFIITSLGRDLTLTDRVYIWRDVLELVKNPMIGTGYESFWLGERLEIMWEKWWFKPNETHNGYIDTYIELGIIGLILLSMIIIKTFTNICETLKVNFNFGRYQISFFSSFLIYNITEAALKLRSTMFFVFLLITLIPIAKNENNHTEDD